MKVVILCGGRGTRISGLAEDLPKPMVAVGGGPILWHIMKYYAHWGHTDFILCLGHKGEAIKDFFLNYRTRIADFTIELGRPDGLRFHNNHLEVDWQVTCAETGLDTLTGSRLKRIERYIGSDESFLLTYGDGVGDLDLDALLSFHASHGGIMTVSAVRPPGRFGELMHDADGRVSEFNEKPQATGGRISGGFFVCRRELFDYLDSNREDETLELGPMRRLVRDGQMMAFLHDGFWQPMDTYRDWQLLSGLVEKGRAPWMVW